MREKYSRRLAAQASKKVQSAAEHQMESMGQSVLLESLNGQNGSKKYQAALQAGGVLMIVVDMVVVVEAWAVDP